MTIDASKVQDAYHYALFVSGPHPITGEESSFTGHNAEFSPSKYLRMAYRTAKEAGCVSVRSPRSLADAMALAVAIKLDARADGIDAFTGERLCTCCNRRPRDTGCDGACYECYDAAQPEPEPEPKAECCRYHGTGGPQSIRCGTDTYLGHGAKAAPSPTRQPTSSTVPTLALPLSDAEMGIVLEAVRALRDAYLEQGLDESQAVDKQAQCLRKSAECLALVDKIEAGAW